MRRGCEDTADMHRLPDTEVLLDWVRQVDRLLEERVAAMSEEAVTQSSRLPGWTRGHVLAHLSRNADALVNLLTWARTGIPTPMYPSTEARNAAIEVGARRGLQEHLDDVAGSARRFMEHATALPQAHWGAQVRSAQGNEIPAADIPWMRVREVWIHVVDLDVGVEFDAVPEPVARTLVQDVAGWMGDRVDRPVHLIDQRGDDTWFGGPAEQAAVSVRGSPQAYAAWLTGRSWGEALVVDPPGRLPELPRWL